MQMEFVCMQALAGALNSVLKQTKRHNLLLDFFQKKIFFFFGFLEFQCFRRLRIDVDNKIF